MHFWIFEGYRNIVLFEWGGRKHVLGIRQQIKYYLFVKRSKNPRYFDERTNRPAIMHPASRAVDSNTA